MIIKRIGTGSEGSGGPIKQFLVKVFIGLVIFLLMGLFLFLLILYLLNPTGVVTTTRQVLIYAGIIAGVLLTVASTLPQSRIVKAGRKHWYLSASS